MSQEYDKVILEHYEGVAKEFGLEATSTMLDHTVRERETELIRSFVGLAVSSMRRPGRTDAEITICDVGCGNGYTLLVLSHKYPDVNFRGIEFTPSLRDIAESRFRGNDKVVISDGDVRSIKPIPDEARFMPTFAGALSDDEISDIAAYLKSLTLD